MLGLGCCAGFSLAVAGRHLIVVASPIAELSSRVLRLQHLWHRSLVSSQPVGSSWTRDGSHVSCVGRGFLTTEPPGRPLEAFLKRYTSA